MRIKLIIIGILLMILIVISSFFVLRDSTHKNSVAEPISITCHTCKIDNCECYIRGCEKGILDVYTEPGCIGFPSFTYMFESMRITWYPTEHRVYYTKILCEDEKISQCTTINVS